MGPHFDGLFGRPAGSVPGYNYSAALQNRDFDWNDETLRGLFIDGPDVYIPGTKMPLQRIANHEQLTDLIEFMREITAPDDKEAKAAD